MTTVVSLFICIWTLTIGQSVNYEFQDSYLASEFYYYVFLWTPVLILLTLFGTVKKSHSNFTKTIVIIATILSSIASFFILLKYIFMIGFGAWITLNIKYEDKSNPKHQIREQIFDIGALGYGDTRVAEVKPFAFLFWKVNEIDTNTIDKMKWKLINKDLDIKTP